MNEIIKPLFYIGTLLKQPFFVPDELRQAEVDHPDSVCDNSAVIARELDAA
jgi:hypothetical protein